MLRGPKRYLPLMQLSADLMNGESELSRPQRETIARTVSETNACQYCVGVHSAVIEELDTAMASDGDDPLVETRRLQPILSYAEKLSRTPAQMEQADVDAILSAGWSEQTVEDVINIVSLFNQLNRILEGIGIKGTGGHFEQAGGTHLVAFYDPIHQAGIDLQYTRGAWLWEFEGIVREGQSDTFAATVAGFAYTLYQIDDPERAVGRNAECVIFFAWQGITTSNGQHTGHPQLAANRNQSAGLSTNSIW